MNEDGLLVVGDPFFLARHRPLTDALRARLGSVDELAIRDTAALPEAAYLAGQFFSGRIWPPTRAAASIARQRFAKRPATFARLSRVAQRALAERRDGRFVLQLFSLSSPTLEPTPFPYAHYVDMTMAQVRRQWPAWAPYERARDYAAWIACEGATYRRAARVFTFSEATRRSVIADYGADPARVVAVGAAGHFHDAAAHERTYGNRTMIFNGSDFERKGGDRALAAFRIVRERIPDATLAVVGGAVADEPGVRNVGRLSRDELFALFDRTDVLLAPTRLDVFPGFVLEAMSRGVVAVLSDAESMDEIVTDGRDGYVVSPPTPERLAERAIELLSGDAALRTCGIAGRTRVEEAWNWDAVAARMLASLARD